MISQFFFPTKYKNEWKEHNLQRWKYQKSNFYENKKLSKTDYIDFNKILVSKKESYDKKIHLLDIMMVSLEHYV